MSLTNISIALASCGVKHEIVIAKRSPVLTAQQYTWLEGEEPLFLFHGTQAPQFRKFKPNSFFTDDYEIALDRASTRSVGVPRVILALIRRSGVRQTPYFGSIQYTVRNPDNILILNQHAEE